MKHCFEEDFNVILVLLSPKQHIAPIIGYNNKKIVSMATYLLIDSIRKGD